MLCTWFVRPTEAVRCAALAHALVTRSGVDHELVLAMKGFESLSEAEPYLEELADLHPRTLFFPDAGLDIGVSLPPQHAYRVLVIVS